MDHKLLAGHHAGRRFFLVVDGLHDVHKRPQNFALNDDDKALHVARLHADFDQIFHLFGRHGERTVNGIADIGEFRQSVFQPLLKIRLQFGQAHAGQIQHVGGRDAQRAGIGDDHHTVAFRDGLLGKGARQREEMLVVPRPDHAALLERGVVDFVVARQRRGVRRHGLFAGFRPSRFQHDDGLAERRPGGDIDKSLPAADVFHVHDDDGNVIVVAQVFQNVRFIDVHLVADGRHDSEVQHIA